MGVDEQPEGSTNGGWDRFSELLTNALVGAVKDDEERAGPEAAETGVPPDHDGSDDHRQRRSGAGDNGMAVAEAGAETPGPDPFDDLERWAPEAGGPSAPPAYAGQAATDIGTWSSEGEGGTGAPSAPSAAAAHSDTWVGDAGTPAAHSDTWLGDAGTPAAHSDTWVGDAGTPAAHGDTWVGYDDAPDTQDDDWLDDADLEQADDQWDEEDIAASLSSRMFGFTSGRGASPPPAHRKQRRQRTEHWPDGALAWWVEHWRAVGTVAAAVLVIALGVVLTTRGSGHSTANSGRVEVSASTTTPTTLSTETRGTTGTTGATDVPSSQPPTTDAGVPAAGNAGLGNQGVTNGAVGGSHIATGRTSGLSGGFVTGAAPSPGGSPAPPAAPPATPDTTAATVPQTTPTTVTRQPPPSFTIPSFTIPTFTTTIPRRTTTTVHVRP
jgi:hypothetical protein